MKLLQFSPKATNGGFRMRLKMHSDTWSTTSLYRGDVGFLHSWFEQNCDFGDAPSPGINWGAISGLALCFAVSAGFWTAIVAFAERVLK